MSSPIGESPQDTSASVTPLSMPGASVPPAIVNPEASSLEFAEAISEAAPKVEVTEAVTTGDTVEIERFKAVQKIARDLEKTAKANSADAEKYRAMMQQLAGPDATSAPDPLTEVKQLREEIESERRERVREQVANTTGVPAALVQGTTREAMEASAEQQLSWAKGLGKSATVPVTAPAANVTSDAKPHETGVTQIVSRDALKSMTSKEIVQAHKDGRMDKLLGK